MDRYTNYYETKTRWVFEHPRKELNYAHAGNMAARTAVFQMIGHFSALPVPGDTELLHRWQRLTNTPSIRYVDDAVVTHHESEHLRDIMLKIFCYGSYARAVNKSHCYRVLSLAERLAVAFRCARDYRYGPVRLSGLVFVLALGLASFEWGRYRSDSIGPRPPA